MRLTMPDRPIRPLRPRVLFPYFVTFILRPNAALDYQTFHAEPQSLLSRRDDTCERLRSLRGLRPYEESAESRASVGQPRRGWQGVTRTPRLRAAFGLLRRATSARYISRQAAKVAKEKHEYFFATTFHDFSRLMLAVACLARKYALRVHSDPLAGRR